jgi:hypothetical protein
VYTRKFDAVGTVEWPSDRLSSCPVFRALSAKEKGCLIESESNVGYVQTVYIRGTNVTRQENLK